MRHDLGGRLQVGHADAVDDEGLAPALARRENRCDIIAAQFAEIEVPHQGSGVQETDGGDAQAGRRQFLVPRF